MSSTSNSPMQKSLPTSFYLSPEIFAMEKEQIFCQQWVCCGREEQLPSPGSHLVAEVGGESILVVRNRAGEIKAHYNVCRHRGTQLCSPGAGSYEDSVKLNGGITAAGIRCSYHLWTYDLDGQLIGAPHLSQEEGFCKADFHLYPVGVATWGGFIFVHLTPDESRAPGRSFLEQLGAAQTRVQRYPLAELRSAHRISYEVAANWKLILENYNECYHCGAVHPELCEVVPAFKENGGAQLDWERGIPHREGAVTFTRSGQTDRAPFPALDEDERVRHKGELVYPNFMLSLASDHAAAFTLWPTDPGHTRVICDFLFHPDEIAKTDFNPQDAVEFWDLVNRQDWAICERVQRGIQSRVHKFGYYAPMEDLSLDIRRYINASLGMKIDDK
jgi:glycine betaine catabolism A